MSKDFLLGLITNRDFLGMALIVLLSVLTWCVNINLSFSFLKHQGTRIQKTLYVSIMVLYSIGGRFFIPIDIFGFVTTAIMTIVLLIFCKNLKAALCSGIYMIAAAAGDILLGLFCVNNKTIFDFIMNTPVGISIGILAENILPAVILLFLINLKVIKLLFAAINISLAVPLFISITSVVGLVYMTGVNFFLSEDPNLKNYILFLSVFVLAISGVLWYISGLKQQIELLRQQYECLKEIKGIVEKKSTKKLKQTLHQFVRETASISQLLSAALEDMEK
jgi:hypothetical protein